MTTHKRAPYSYSTIPDSPACDPLLPKASFPLLNPPIQILNSILETIWVNDVANNGKSWSMWRAQFQTQYPQAEMTPKNDEKNVEL